MAPMTQRFLVLPTKAAALARSAEQYRAMCASPCPENVTKYWWPVLELSDGTAVVVVNAEGPYSATGLRAAETAALKTQEQRAPTEAEMKAVEEKK